MNLPGKFIFMTLRFSKPLQLPPREPHLCMAEGLLCVCAYQSPFYSSKHEGSPPLHGAPPLGPKGSPP